MIKLFSLKNTANFLVVSAITILLFLSCKKASSDGGGTVTASTPPDLTSTVNSALVSGFVTDENEAAVKSAAVQIGTAFVTTDKYGYFEARNVNVIKNAATVSVTKAGYFKSIKTYIATADKSVFFRIKMIPKNNAGNVNGASGGAVTLSNGMAINFPAAGVVNAATNAAYTGTVNVAAYWINPTSNDLPRIMPGDLRGLNTDGNLQLLTTYGMAAVELTGSGGELLQIAAGKKVTLTMPIPAALVGSAPAYIPLWYFDEAKGLWKQEGSATKNGSNYVGEVSHFSFWNYGSPFDYVQFDCKVVNTAGQPIQNAIVKISVVSNPVNAIQGYTDSAGYVNMAVPGLSQLKLEIFSPNGCAAAYYSQMFTTGIIGNVSLGTIITNNTSLAANINGTANTCTGAPVSNGYLMLLNGNQYFRYPIANNGMFNFNIILCSAPYNVSIIVEDIINSQQSAPAVFNINAGNNNISSIQACGTSTFQYVDYTLDTTLHHYSNPADSILLSSSSAHNTLSFYSPANSTNYAVLGFSNTNIGIGSSQILDTISGPGFPFAYTRPAPILVNITEYGTIGQFVSGNFNGTIIGPAPFNRVYNLTCSFRYKRK
jgi:hypothetical protein